MSCSLENTPSWRCVRVANEDITDINQQELINGTVFPITQLGPRSQPSIWSRGPNQPSGTVVSASIWDHGLNHPSGTVVSTTHLEPWSQPPIWNRGPNHPPGTVVPTTHLGPWSQPPIWDRGPNHATGPRS